MTQIPDASVRADLAKVKHMAERSYEFDIPDQNGAWPDFQDAMVTVGELRALRRILPQIVTKPVDVVAVRRQALEEAATLIDEGFEKEVGKPWRNDGKPSKNDRCPHDKFMYEDCENCASDAIRALSAAPTPEAEA